MTLENSKRGVRHWRIRHRTWVYVDDDGWYEFLWRLGPSGNVWIRGCVDADMTVVWFDWP